MKKLTTEEFIKRAREIHGNKYDYSKVKYIDSHTKVCIICPIHGEFLQQPYCHLLLKQGCPKCSHRSFKYTTEEFIEKAKTIHDNKYDYSKVEYKNAHTKVCIVCPKHGEFWQNPKDHLSGKGCMKCSGKEKHTTEQWIEKAREIHGDKYDYSKVDYKNSKTKICIICPKHGEFWQTPNSHLNGKGCGKCASNIQLTTEEFIKRAREIHENKYDYSKVDYINSNTKVCIICPIHGEFWQQPSLHLNVEHGCPYCNESHLERDIAKLLTENDIKFERQKRFEWLGKQSLDFYLPNKNIAIECQGEQHYISKSFFDKRNSLEDRKALDKNKKDKCNENGINIIYYSDIKYDDELITNFDKILEICQ